MGQVGIFRMIYQSTNKVIPVNLTEQEMFFVEAYAQSASEDKLIAMDFEFVLSDGLIDQLEVDNTNSCLTGTSPPKSLLHRYRRDKKK